MKVSRFIVYPQVFAADVVAGATPREICRLDGDLAAVNPGSVSSEMSAEERIVDAMIRPRLESGLLSEWEGTYRSAGLTDRWIEVVRNLRLRNRGAFCTVHGTHAPSIDTRWVEQGGSAHEAPDTQKHEVNPGPYYTLKLDVKVPAHRRADGPPPLTTTRPDSPPRRPYPADPQDAAAVDALAQHLAPRVGVTFGGAERLKMFPVLAPICAVTATVMAAMEETASRTAKETRYRRDVLDACLDALELGPHGGTAERILLRDHPEHVHIDVRAVPENFVRDAWREGLGLLAAHPKGGLHRILRSERRSVMPRILFSIGGPEPY